VGHVALALYAQGSAPHDVFLEEARALCAEVDKETPLPARASRAPWRHRSAGARHDSTLRAIAAGVGTAAERDGRLHAATS
jgi:hypothetical protein